MRRVDNRIPLLLIGLFTICYGGLAFSSLRLKSVVRDEPVHWKFGEELMTIGSDAYPFRGVGPVSILNVYAAKRLGVDIFDSTGLIAARLPTVVIGMLLIVCVSAFSWQLFGPWSGVFSGVLAAFEPNLIAHGRFLTTDIPVSAGICLCLFAIWRYSVHPGRWRAIFIGIAIAAALLSKVTGLIIMLLLPIYWGFMILNHRKTPDSHRPSVSMVAIDLGVVLLAAMLCVNAGFGFQGVLTPVKDYEFLSPVFRSFTSWLPDHLPIPFPYVFIRCLDYSFWFSEVGHPVQPFLNGEFSRTGFPHYYLVAFLIKSTVGFLLLVIGAIACQFLRKERNLAELTLFLGLPVMGMFLYFSLFNPIQLGLRYILPIYPILCVLMGSLIQGIRHRMGQWILSVLLIAHIVESTAVWPHYLEFFNITIGGPAQGYRYLNDSNIDWGQDMHILEKYVQSSDQPVIINPESPVSGRIAVNANRMFMEKYEWLRNREPIHRVAYTWFIFDVEGPENGTSPDQPVFTDFSASALHGSGSAATRSPAFSRLRGMDQSLIGPQFDTPKPESVTRHAAMGTTGPEHSGTRSIPSSDSELPEQKKSAAYAGANVLFISIDTLRSDHVGSYGHRLPTSPTLDAFARRSIVFEEARCQVPRTTPSHSGMFTGLSPGEHGSVMNCQPIRPDVPTMAEILKRSGYRTGAVVSSAVLSGLASGLNRGFDWYEDSGSGNSLRLEENTPAPESHTEKASDSTKDRRKIQGKILFAGGEGEMATRVTPFERTGDVSTQLALDWLGRQQSGPYMLWIHYFDPHSSYKPPEIFGKIFAPFYSRQGNMIDIMARKKNDLPIDLENWNQFHGLYDGEIRFVDTQLMRLFRYLSDTDRMENTIIIVLADHGESLGEYQGYVGHGEHLNEGSIRIPLIWHLPGMTSGHVLTEPVDPSDIMPTLLALLGVDAPQKMSGRNLLKELAGESGALSQNMTFSQSAAAGKGDAMRVRFSVTWDRMKYIGDLYCNRSQGFGEYDQTSDDLTDFALYDLGVDPQELTDMRTLSLDKLNLYRDVMKQWLSGHRHGIMERLSVKEDIDNQNRQFLEALGYLEE